MVKKLVVNEEIEKLIDICKSDSKICGYKLRDAHYNLGKYLGKFIINNEDIENKKIAVIAMMRAGLMFALGIAKSLEENNDVDFIFSNQDELNLNEYDQIIIADAVINSGKTIFKFIENNNLSNVIIATNVLSNKNIELFDKINLYTVRISEHSYIGTKEKIIRNGKGPDTGDRLFSSMFYIENK